MSLSLPWTGERFLPEMTGDIACEHLHRYAVATKVAVGKIVVDLASGEGYGSKLLAKVATTVIGIDADPVSVEYSKQVYSCDNLRFLVGTCDRIPLPAHCAD